MRAIVPANLDSPEHADAIVWLLNEYATDPMGGASPLSQQTKANLIPALRDRTDSCVVLAWDNGQPVGLAICFEGFSTFACKPTMNIHDLYVRPTHRGQGVSIALLEIITSIAVQRGCCKLTLEVLEGNLAAQRVYSKFGFAAYQLDPEIGRAMFWQKSLIDR